MKNEKGSVVLIVIFVVVILLIIGAAYYFMTLNQKNSAITEQTPVVQPPSKTVTVPAKTPSTLSAELDSIQVSELDSSFSQIDQDLKDL